MHDCHAHVYERVSAFGTPRYVPTRPAPLESWLAHLRREDVAGGVIVQTSFLGFDNSELLGALARTGTESFRGVAVVDIGAGQEELDHLKAQGIEGIRWNLVEGAAIPDPDDADVAAFLARLDKAGLHLEIHLESPHLAALLPRLLAHVGRVVVDHFGLPVAEDPSGDPWIRALRKVDADDRVFVKFSAPYRCPVPVAPHAREIVEIVGETQVVWGSDWPWTRHESDGDYAALVQLWHEWMPNPRKATLGADKLYGLSSSEATLSASQSGGWLWIRRPANT